jgi:DNA-binding MarR family transcriptional regulator
MTPTANDGWRSQHLGRLLGHAMRRFDARVLDLMSRDEAAPLALANLAARQKIGASHVHIVRHLALAGERPRDLARAAGVSKQAAGQIVAQCAAWGLITLEKDPHDARARIARFTPAGLDWLAAFERAVRRAEAEFTASTGEAVATVVRLGLEAYAGGWDAWSVTQGP